ncbi:unknown [Firmicutes bacterium CAG:114]|nr:unknown [Firmicutes bacterium CAG:114]
MIQVTGVTGVESKENPARPATFKYNFDVKYIGEEVKVLYKDETGGNANIPDKNDTIYGVVVTGNTTVYNITKGDLQDTATKNKIKFNDKEYKVAAATNEKVEAINYNYGNTTKTVATSSADFNSYKSAFDSLKADSADTIKFIVKDGEIVKAYVVETQFAEIVSINSTKLSLSGGVNKAGLVIEDNSVYEGAKKNDIVAVQKLYSDDYYVISKADIVESTVSASKSNTEVKIDGNYAKLCTTTGTKSIGDYDLHAITDLGESYAFIMYGDYWVAAQQVTESTKDYAVVEKIDANYENAVNPSVKLIKADGTKATAAIDSDSDTNIVAGELVKYKTNNDGSVEMTKAKTANSGKNLVNDTLNILSNATVSYNKNTKQLAFGDNTKKATTSDCVAFIEYETGKYMVAPSDSLGSFTSKTGKAYISLDKDGKVVAFLVSTDGKPSNNASDDVYGYITSRGTEKIGDDTYVMLDVWTADGNITLKTEDLSTTQEKALVAGAFIKFKAGSDVTNAADITDLTKTVKKIRVDDYDADRQLLTQKDGTQWPVDKDVTLITINYSEKEGVEDQFDTIPTYDSEANTYNAAIVVDKVDGVDTVVAVYIDVNSDMGK